MTMSVRIGDTYIRRLEKITISRSVENLCDTATIVIPSARYNAPFPLSEDIKVGADVKIELGYNDRVTTEFKGYVNKITANDGTVTVECEDEIYLFRVDMKNESIAKASVSAILERCADAVKKAKGKRFAIDCDYNFLYDKFTICNTTAYEVIKKIQEEAKPNIYIKDSTLHVHPQYTKTSGIADYDFAVNIDRDGTDLTYKTPEDQKLIVEVTSKNSKGETIKVTEGTPGGDRIQLNMPQVTDEESLRTAAREMLSRKVYSGYEGSFTGWLIPYCDAGYKVNLTDREKEYRSGTYYVTAVEVEFSQAGGKRKVTIGKKL